MALSNEIRELQNIVALEELKRHWDKSESYRVLDDLNYQPSKSYLKAQEILNREFTGNLKAKIDLLGVITIYEEIDNPIIEQMTGKRAMKLKEYVAPSVKLPYAYVMGKKIGKKVTQSILKEYGMSL